MTVPTLHLRDSAIAASQGLRKQIAALCEKGAAVIAIAKQMALGQTSGGEPLSWTEKLWAQRPVPAHAATRQPPKARG